MIQIPLRYSDQIFAHAFIDDDQEQLLDLGYFSVALPRSLRQLARGRPDIILACLREDESVRRNCRPFISIIKTQIMLVHMVLRPEIVRLLQVGFDVEPRLRYKIQELRSSIGRVSYVNGDKTDCRVENLRELQ